MKKVIIQFCSACAVAVAAMLLAAGCSKGAESNYAPSDSSGGKGGSMARFTISGDWLYTVNSNQLTVVSLANPAKPVEGERFWVGSNIETIFSMDTLLFVGSQNGMFIYNIKNREYPRQLSSTWHLQSCDPVVAADTLAFVTLNSSLGAWCGRSTNVLQVYDISDPTKVGDPICTVNMSSPRGLAVDIERKMLFVCDNGIKAYDISDPRNIKEPMYTGISEANIGNIDAYDCILWQDRLLVIGSDGLYQLAYDREKFTFISKIDLRKE